jgi:hypothetical protein
VKRGGKVETGMYGGVKFDVATGTATAFVWVPAPAFLHEVPPGQLSMGGALADLK